MQEQDGGWFDDVDKDTLSLKNKIHDWINDSELEKRTNMKQKTSIFKKSSTYQQVERHQQVLHQRDHQRVKWI